MIGRTLVAAFVLAAAVPAQAGQAPAADYDALVAAGQRALDDGDLARALQLATVAIGVADRRHEAFVLAAAALLSRGDQRAMDEALQNALERANGAARTKLAAQVQLLHGRLDPARVEQMVAGAHAALAERLPAKAGRLLEEACRIAPARTDLALHAAHAFVAADDPPAARRVVLSVLGGATGAARSRLETLAARLEPIVRVGYEAELARVRAAFATRRNAEAAAGCQRAIRTMPDRFEAYRLRASLELARGEPDRAIESLRQAVARGFLDRDAWLADLSGELHALREEPALVRLVTDAFGSDLLAEAAAAPAAETAAPATVDNSVGMRLVRIEPGAFTMGSPTGERDRDYTCEREHRVRIEQPFYLGATEVTQKQWQAIMGANPSVHRGDDLPVHRVTFVEACEFCRRLTEREGRIYRLPREAEWEFACRASGAGRLPEGVEEPGLGDFAHFSATAGQHAAPRTVATLQPNALGLHDMLGNVYEWCQDWFAPYAGESATDPTGPATGTLRVARGGAWTSQAHALRCAHRARFDPSRPYPTLGLRVVLEVDPAPVK
jgi:formylglycine-generating enzyme required for sulfatase activity